MTRIYDRLKCFGDVSIFMKYFCRLDITGHIFDNCVGFVLFFRALIRFGFFKSSTRSFIPIAYFKLTNARLY